MDIRILLALQNFREATGGFLNTFLVFVSEIAVDYFILIPALVLFWCFDKKKASKILLSWGTSLGVGQFLKGTFCVYRPWIKDARVMPPAEIFAGATGYSFPSGHSFSAGGFWNAVAICYKKYKAVVIFSVIMVLITMFSRICLGVHTPQDVLVGAALSILCAFGIDKLYDWIEANNNRDIIILIIATVLCAALMLYLSYKSYPMDYVDGVLLVDPRKMTVDGFKDPGRFWGIVVGWFIERRFVKFDSEGTTVQKTLRSLVGGILVAFWWTAVAGPLGKAIDTGVGHFLMQSTTPIIFMTVYPLIFKKLESKSADKQC